MGTPRSIASTRRCWRPDPPRQTPNALSCLGHRDVFAQSCRAVKRTLPILTLALWLLAGCGRAVPPSPTATMASPSVEPLTTRIERTRTIPAPTDRPTEIEPTRTRPAATDRPTDTPPLATGGLLRLTDDPARDSSPAWSGDGKRIVFYSNRTGVDEIYAMDADGGDLIQLTEEPEVGFKGEPAWSPDGRQIAFTAFLEKARIFAFDVELAESQPFSPIRPTTEGNPESLSEQDKDSFAAAWSPDGRQIALVMEDVDGHLQVFTMDLTSGETHQVTRAPLDVYRSAWAPDGRWIAFSASAGGNEEIYLISASGGGMTRLTNNPALDSEPSWSPDGRYIVFSSEREGQRKLFVMRADGSNVTRLDFGLSEGATPAWSPDGGTIAFVSEQDGNYDIYRIDAPALAP